MSNDFNEQALRQRCAEHLVPFKIPARIDEILRTGSGKRFALARAAAHAVPKRLLIGGEWRESATGATFTVEDPATGEVVARVADAAPRDSSLALGAATAAAAFGAERAQLVAIARAVACRHVANNRELLNGETVRRTPCVSFACSACTPEGQL
jgi:hypothetical protein